MRSAKSAIGSPGQASRFKISSEAGACPDDHRRQAWQTMRGLSKRARLTPPGDLFQSMTGVTAETMRPRHRDCDFGSNARGWSERQSATQGRHGDRGRHKARTAAGGRCAVSATAAIIRWQIRPLDSGGERHGAQTKAQDLAGFFWPAEVAAILGIGIVSVYAYINAPEKARRFVDSPNPRSD
jgi:hypothetical protein